MTFWQIFFRVLLKRPTEALAALYWHVTRRRLRAQNCLRAASAKLPFGYDLWISTVERTPELRREAGAAIETWRWKPNFLIQVFGHETCTEKQFRTSIQSVERQIYPSWTLLGRGEAAPEEESEGSSFDFIVPLRAGDTLSEAAFFRFAEALQANPSAAILYGDNDELDRRGRRVRPWFKPGWNSEMFLALDYLSQAVAIKSSLASEIGLFAEELTSERLGDALLRATTLANGSILHLPHVLCHVDGSFGDSGLKNRVNLVSRHLQSSGGICSPGPFGTTKVSWPLPASLPQVSIIIPTRDKVELLRPCIDSVLRLTDYQCFEIIVVDNASAAPESLAYFKEIGTHPAIRVLRHDEPYNFSAINNLAARHAKGAFLCLLNNDTEIVEPEWLTEMMRYAVRPEVGAVGAKLLYGDGSIQHAGIVIGMGDAAGHAHRFTPANQPGYFRQPHVSQFVTAVTAACLVIAKQKFEAVGGFDEEKLAIAYNDVDLCLKLQAAGWRNVYVPHATLLHHESKSRDSDFSPTQHGRYLSELRVLQERWETKSRQDPQHNPNLDRYSETFVIRL